MTGVLAGNTVHADLAFLKLEPGRGMNSIVDWLHYVRPQKPVNRALRATLTHPAAPPLDS
jgi:hypothetical protein